VWRACVLSKFTKVVFPSSDNRLDGVLDLVHTNVCGPMSQAALIGCEYYIRFIDDHSRNTSIYLLKSNNEVFKRFQEFKALVENQKGKRIKVLWSDNKGEYASREFVDLCTHTGIKRKMTMPYNYPQ
jgi:hypothetical protein